MKTISDINSTIYSVVGGPVMLALLVGAGIYLTVRLRFFQITKIGLWMKSTLGSLKRNRMSTTGSVTPFQALSAALAGTIGVGNIAGVATAIVAGGPGAIFWMWVSAFFGMMTKYAEIVLALHFRRRKKRGEWVGGPMYYIEQGLGFKWLAVLFAVFTLAATLGVGNMAQANSAALALEAGLGIPKIVSGIALALFAGTVILGGVKRIVRVTEVVVPFIGIIYTFGALAVIVLRADVLGDIFASIFRDAFSLKSVGGGVLGYAFMTSMRYGIARGVFTNEAGLGSAPIVHATADTDHPVKQGMWGIFEVFADTIVMCTLSALVILQSGLVGAVDAFTGEALDGAALSSAAFDSAIPGFGSIFVSIAILLFAAPTLLSWSYYGEKSLEYLRGGNTSKMSLLLYRTIFVAVIIPSAMMDLNLVWEISDTFNMLMALPNLFAVLCMSGLVIKLTKDYKNKRLYGNP